MTKLIGIAGRKHAGKDTAANILVEERGYTNVKFADGIKQAAKLFFAFLEFDDESIARLVDGVSKEVPLDNLKGNASELHFESFVDTHIGELADILDIPVLALAELDLPAFTGDTSREFQQFFGTEIGRNLVGPTVWTDAALSKVRAATTPVVISDVRFANEIDAIRDFGGTSIRIKRDAAAEGNEFSNHPSETAIDTLNVDLEIDNNHTLNDLYWSVLIAADEAPADHGAVGFITRF